MLRKKTCIYAEKHQEAKNICLNLQKLSILFRFSPKGLIFFFSTKVVAGLFFYFFRRKKTDKHLKMCMFLQSAIERLVKDKMPKKSGRWWLSWRRRDMADSQVSAQRLPGGAVRWENTLGHAPLPRGCGFAHFALMTDNTKSEACSRCRFFSRNSPRRSRRSRWREPPPRLGE